MRVIKIDDKHNYDGINRILKRQSSRAIIIENEKIYLSHSKALGYYKLPGGGVDRGESLVEAAIRETMEETGLKIVESSLKEFGVYIEIRKSIKPGENDTIWENTSYHYIANVYDEKYEPKLTLSEQKEECERVLIDPLLAIEYNKSVNSPFIERENYMLKIIYEELIKK